MTLEFVDNYLNAKLAQNREIIKFSSVFAKFNTLKCNIFENTPQVDLGACKNQSSGLYSVTAIR